MVGTGVCLLRILTKDRNVGANKNVLSNGGF
jgi:hypothetical protein